MPGYQIGVSQIPEIQLLAHRVKTEGLVLQSGPGSGHTVATFQRQVLLDCYVGKAVLSYIELVWSSDRAKIFGKKCTVNCNEAIDYYSGELRVIDTIS